ncbi:MAG TPA: peptidoglycan bridge formation glycyltransferase FemA/FemB family protein [Patescibacteria group bacterium]|jgi:lipid II:glycine glycyltransferase (peptidoglycan interpeptide bridge formation enzyme)
MQVEDLSRAKGAWNKFARENRGGVLQSYEWGRFRQEMEWDVSYVGIRDGKQTRLQAVVMRKALPGGYGFYYVPEGPVVKDGDWKDAKNREALKEFVAHLEERAHEDKTVFVKVDPHFAVEEFPTDWLAEAGFRDSPEDVQAAVVSEVDLRPDPEDIFVSFKQKGRYNVRKAVKHGVKVRKGTGQKELDQFYMLLEETAKRQGITYREKWYYELFRKYLMQEHDDATFFIASHNNEPVAATLVTFFGDEAVYLYGGSTQADRNLYASYLIQWSGMEEARRRGCTFYNMTGIASTDDQNDAWAGLRQFKLKFGGGQTNLVGARDYVFRPVEYFLFTNADRVRRKLAKRSGR